MSQVQESCSANTTQGEIDNFASQYVDLLVASNQGESLTDAQIKAIKPSLYDHLNNCKHCNMRFQQAVEMARLSQQVTAYDNY